MLIQTSRLRLRPLTLDDAPFMLKIMNEPAYYQNVGDRGVRTIEQCRAYMQEKILNPFAKQGYGLCLTELLDGTPVGFCGLLKREVFAEHDIGYAFATEHWGKGYATEAASAMIDYGRTSIQLPSLAAVVDPKNTASIRVLKKLGFEYQKMVRLNEGDIELGYYSRSL